MTIIKLYKPIGKTPLELINEYKKKHNIKKISYAGRLDPMAEGEMLILTNDSCLKQNFYHNLGKTYRFELLVGLSTDTYDILGLVNDIYSKDISNEKKIELNSIIQNYIGKHMQKYPPYSSVRVKGNPLWYYAKNNKLNEITIPEKEINIYRMKILTNYSINTNELLQKIFNNINKINNEYDFRQDLIKNNWKKIINKNYYVLELETDVSSGTYIRQICNDIGIKLKIPCLALSINRLNILV